MGKRPSEHPDPLVRLQRRIRNIRRLLVAWTLRPLLWLLVHTPRPLLLLVSRAIVTPILRLLLWRRAERNLRLAFRDSLSPAERRRILRTMFRRFAQLIADVVVFPRLGRRLCELNLDAAEGLRSMQEFERSTGTGWVGVTGHIGNWELLAQWMHWNSVCGVGGIVVKRQPNPHLNAIIERLRGSHGMTTLYRDDNPVGILRLLRAGRAIGMAPDQDVASVGGMFIEFFGRPAYTPIGPARLAWTANVPIRVAYVRRGEDGGQQVRFEAPVFPDRSKPRHEEIARLTRAWSAQLEAAIRAQPDQWLWFHDRWKTTPEKLAGRGRQPADL